MLKNVFNPMLKYIQSQGKIYSIAEQNIFIPMSIYSISMVTRSQRHVAFRNRKRSPTFATEERGCSPGTYEVYRRVGVHGLRGTLAGFLEN